MRAWADHRTRWTAWERVSPATSVSQTNASMPTADQEQNGADLAAGAETPTDATDLLRAFPLL